MNSKEIKLSIKNFDIECGPGHVGFGTIYLVKEKNTQKEYVAKIFDFNGNEEQEGIMQEMTCLKHPTIIKFIGITHEDFEGDLKTIIFMEYAKNGSLYNLIQSKNYQNIDNTTRQLILVGVARGLNFLHNHQIIHMDIKTDNVLLDDSFHPKISNFGAAQKKSNITHICGTLFYQAPELLKKDYEFDEKVDIYSFSILMYQVLTGINIFTLFKDNKKPRFNYLIEILNGTRPEFPVQIKNSLKELIEKCWSEDPDERPTSEELYKKLAFEKNYYLDDVDADILQQYINEINDE